MSYPIFVEPLAPALFRHWAQSGTNRSSFLSTSPKRLENNFPHKRLCHQCRICLQSSYFLVRFDTSPSLIPPRRSTFIALATPSYNLVLPVSDSGNINIPSKLMAETHSLPNPLVNQGSLLVATIDSPGIRIVMGTIS